VIMDLDSGAGCGVAERIAASIHSVTPGDHLAVRMRFMPRRGPESHERHTELYHGGHGHGLHHRGRRDGRD
jgi:hypothetical protein